MRRLPEEVKRRVKALKNLQVKHATLAAEFEKEVAALELKFVGLHQPLYDQVCIEVLFLYDFLMLKDSHALTEIFLLIVLPCSD